MENLENSEKEQYKEKKVHGRYSKTKREKIQNLAAKIISDYTGTHLAELTGYMLIDQEIRMLLRIEKNGVVKDLCKAVHELPNDEIHSVLEQYETHNLKKRYIEKYSHKLPGQKEGDIGNILIKLGKKSQFIKSIEKYILPLSGLTPEEIQVLIEESHPNTFKKNYKTDE